MWAIAAAVGAFSFFAQILMTHAYGALTVAEAALWQQLTPIASFAWAVLLLDEKPTPVVVLGILVGAAGVVYGSVLGHEPAHREPGAAASGGAPPDEPARRDTGTEPRR
jgi:drug/metabolite transporter (DMT)-like permease